MDRKMGAATTLQQFMSDTFETQRQGQPEAFELVRGKSFLKVNLGAAGSDGNALTQVWVKGSSLVANRGQVLLTRDPNSDSGTGIMLATAAAYPAAGAHLFLASESCHVILLRLGGGGNVESLAVNTAALLAFEPTVAHTIRRVQLGGGGAGGIVANNTAPVVKIALLQGYGFVALLTQGPPMTVAIAPGMPHLCADPQSTIAWSSNVIFPHLAPKPGFLDTAENRSKGSDDKFQLNFSHTLNNAQGYVILQPVEETSRNILDTIRKGLTTAGSWTFRIFQCFSSPAM